jgi:hypothetical protein
MSNNPVKTEQNIATDELVLNNQEQGLKLNFLKVVSYSHIPTIFNSSTIKTTGLKFMDFCSGIGAGRIGLNNLGMQCAGFSEIDKNAERTYREFFGYEEKNYGDLMKINTNELPDFDLMIAGFPCQTFSVIGQRKGMGNER